MVGTWRKTLHQTAIFGFAILSSGVISSCVSNKDIMERQRLEALAKREQAPVLFHWDDTVEASGRTSVRIQLSEQKAYIFQGGQEVAWTYIATGRGRHATPRGKYRVMEKQEDKRSNRYGVIENANGEVVDHDATEGKEPIPLGGRFVGASMPYWMRLTGYGIGMHAGYIPNPGHPASHGCIRLPEELARRLFEVVKVGTEVTVQ